MWHKFKKMRRYFYAAVLYMCCHCACSAVLLCYCSVLLCYCAGMLCCMLCCCAMLYVCCYWAVLACSAVLLCSCAALLLCYVTVLCYCTIVLLYMPYVPTPMPICPYPYAPISAIPIFPYSPSKSALFPIPIPLFPLKCAAYVYATILFNVLRATSCEL
jgi:hypothetical protein